MDLHSEPEQASAISSFFLHSTPGVPALDGGTKVPVEQQCIEPQQGTALAES